MTGKKTKFTDERLRNYGCENDKQRTFFIDAEQPGLRLQVTPTGTKTFQARAWHPTKKRAITLTLGRWPGMPLTSARQKTKIFLAEIASGNDPHSERQQQRSIPTVGSMLTRFLEDHSKLHKRSWRDDERMIRCHLRPAFDAVRIDELSTPQVRSWHSDLTQQMTPAAANRHLALLRSAYNFMSPENSNPCSRVKMFEEVPRERFLRQDEFAAFFKSVETERVEGNPDIADYVLLSLFTGARRSNVLGMRWRDIDMNLRQWRVPAPDAKRKSSMTIPIVDEVEAILERRKKTADNMFVLSGTGKSGHLQEPRKGWARILARAGIEDMRLHDLRHTMGTWLMVDGAAINVVAEALGHRNVSTTMKYIHTVEGAVHNSMSTTVSRMNSVAAMPTDEQQA